MNSDQIMGVLIAIFMAFLMGLFTGTKLSTYSWCEDSVKQGHAEYSATTGVWQWKTPSPAEKGAK